jgi:N-acetylmuramoyl-L-alanine amidase
MLRKQKETFSILKQKWGDKVKVIIDPGHGGEDNGGGTNSLFKEKDWVLQVSLYQAKLLRDAGYEVFLSRITDEYISPKERVKRVKNSGADICLCNHVNAGGGTGFECYHSIFAPPTWGRYVVEQIKHSDIGLREPAIKTRRLDTVKDYYFMHRDTGRVQTLIVEYGFGDNPRDAQKLDRNWQEYAKLVIDGTINYLEVV